MRGNILFSIMLYGLVLCSYAQEETLPKAPDDHIWTLRYCIEYAIQNNLTLQRANYDVALSELDRTKAKMAMLPTLNGNGNYGFNWGRTIDPTSNLFVEQRVKSINASLSSNWLLWNGFRLFYSYKQSDMEWQATTQDQLKAKNDLILNIMTLYLNIVVNNELLLTAKSQVNSTQQQLLQTNKLAEAGAVPRSDVLNLEAQLATNELQVVRNENAWYLSKLQLKQALRLPASEPFEVEPPELPELASGVIKESSEHIFEMATMLMPEMESARLRQKGSLYSLRASRGNLYPTLNLSGSISTIYSDARQVFVPDGDPILQPIPVGYVPSTMETVVEDRNITPGYFQVPSVGDQFRDNQGKSLGFNLSIPIFNGLTARSRVRQALINQEVTDIAYLEMENQLRQSIELAYTDAVAASKTFSATQKQVDARQEAFRLIEQREKAGAATFIEYQISQNDLFQAESDLVRAKYDYFFKLKILDFYQGETIDF